MDNANHLLKGSPQDEMPIIQTTVSNPLENTHCGSAPKESKIVPGVVARIQLSHRKWPQEEMSSIKQQIGM